MNYLTTWGDEAILKALGKETKPQVNTAPIQSASSNLPGWVCDLRQGPKETKKIKKTSLVGVKIEKAAEGLGADAACWATLNRSSVLDPTKDGQWVTLLTEDQLNLRGGPFSGWQVRTDNWTEDFAIQLTCRVSGNPDGRDRNHCGSWHLQGVLHKKGVYHRLCFKIPHRDASQQSWVYRLHLAIINK